MDLKSILVRDIPTDVESWLVEECQKRNYTKQKLLISIIRDAQARGPQLRIFDGPPAAPRATSEVLMPFTFIDLFAGIGGMRIGLEAVGGKCVFTSEYDSHCQRTYHAWFGEKPHGDITKISSSEIPKHDVLAAGFPCQPFSIAGVSKKNSLGRPHGFDDLKQGNLFFHLARIIKEKRPPVFLLENVKNLRSHDGKRTYNTIYSTLHDELGYNVFAKVIDAAGWVPQHRERIFIVGFDPKVFGDNPDFEFPAAPHGAAHRLGDVLDASVDPKYVLSQHLWKYLRDYAARHRAKGNGFGFGLVTEDSITRTLSARYYKDGSEILISRGKGRRPRRLTPREAGRLMGFPDHLKIEVSDTQAYKQFGNAVVPKVVEAIGRRITSVFSSYLLDGRGGSIVGSSQPFEESVIQRGV